MDATTLRGASLRARSRSSTVARQNGDRVLELKSGDLFIENVQVPRSLPPGGELQFSFDVGNGALTINGDDPDCCGDACGQPLPSILNGFMYAYDFDTSWGEAVSETGCIGTTELGANIVTQTGSVPVPEQPGSYSFTLRFRTLGSGEEVEEVYFLEVDPEAPPGGVECRTNADCGPSEVCENGSCVAEDPDDRNGNGNGGGDAQFRPLICLINPTRDCTTPETIANGVILLVFVYGLASNLTQVA